MATDTPDYQALKAKHDPTITEKLEFTAYELRDTSIFLVRGVRTADIIHRIPGDVFVNDRRILYKKTILRRRNFKHVVRIPALKVKFSCHLSRHM